MANPLRRFKYLPWRSLFIVSSLVTVIVIVLDFLIAFGFVYSPAINRTLTLLYSGPLGVIMSFALPVGIGALAVYLLERLYKLTINTAVLWALIPCLAVCLIVKALIPLPKPLGTFNELQLMGIIVGVFWKGRSYWR